LTAVGLTGFILAGRKVWWSWYVNLFCQVLWFAYALATKQYGFIVASLAYTFVFSQNTYKWTKEHRAKWECGLCLSRPWLSRWQLFWANRAILVNCTACGRKYAKPEPRQVIIDAKD